MEQTFTGSLHFLNGGGELGRLTRNYNWETTALGQPELWPQSLKTALSILLSSKHPMFIWWGEEMIQFYNDAYRPSLGKSGKHPAALGQRGIDCWPEIWPVIYPLIRQVQDTGEATWSEDQLIPIYRNGQLEDVYWTFGYSPIMGETEAVEGVLVVCNETTDKVKMLMRLEESNKRFHNLVMRAPVAIAVFRSENLIAEIANEAYLPLLGISPEEFIGRSLFETHPELEGKIKPIVETVYATGKPYRQNEFPVTIIRNGSIQECFFNFVYEPLLEEGKTDGIMVVAHEVTNHVHSRRELEKSELQVRSLIESAPFPIGVYIGREMRITFTNDSIRNVWGKGNDINGRLYADVLPELEQQNIYEKLDNVYKTGIPYHGINEEIELEVNGLINKFYFNYSFTPLVDAEGKVYGIMNTAADVTALNLAKQKYQKSEENLRNTILQAPLAMCILNGPDFIVEIANNRMFELWGLRAADILNKPIFEGLQETRDEFENILKEVYTTGNAFSAYDVPAQLPRPGGTETIYINFVYSPYREAKGEVTGIIVIAIDVTAQVMARHSIEEVVEARTRELANVNRNLQKSNAELAQFAYIASHDLQEPLRKISMYSQMLEDHLGDVAEKPKSFLQKINNSSQRMNRLIKDVLSYSELSKDYSGWQKVDLQQTFSNIITDYELLIEQKKAKIEFHNLPVIEAIPLQMTQLFSNLLSNALKFAHADMPAVINVSAEKMEEPEVRCNPQLIDGLRYYHIIFSDNGIGFKADHAEQIFHIFQRLHRKSEYPGTGIGLAMCRKIARNHHGDLHAVGRPGLGSEFHLLIPQKQPDNQFRN